MRKFKNFLVNRYFLIATISFFWYCWGLFYNGSNSYSAIADFNIYFKRSIDIFANSDHICAIGSYQGAMNPFFFIVMGWVANFLGNELIIFQIFNIAITLPIFPAIYKLARKHDFSDKTSFLITLSFIFSYSLRASALGINTDHLAFVFMFWSYYIFAFNLPSLKYSAILSMFFAFLAFYTRQFYAPFLVLIICVNFYENKEKWFRITLLLFALLLSLPELYLVFTWGSFLTPGFQHHFKINEIPKNITYFMSIFILVMTPLLAVKQNLKTLIDIFYRKLSNIIIFSFAAIILGSLYYSSDTTMMGGGLLTVPIKIWGHGSIYTNIYASLLIFIGLWIFSALDFKSSILTIFLLSPIIISSLVFYRYFDPYIFFVLIFMTKRFPVKEGAIDLTEVKFLPYFQMAMFVIIFTSQILKEIYHGIFR